MNLYFVFIVSAFALFGLAFGSFANVVIWRLPRGESFVTPPSHCPACGTDIRWYDNIPVVSWMVLGGRCRDCSEPISARYFFVEIACGVLFVLAAITFGPTPRGVAAAMLFWFLLVLSAIDIDHYRLPNGLVGALAALGLLGASVAQFTAVPVVPLLGPAEGEGILFQPLAMAIVGMVLGGGLSGGIAFLYSLIRRRRGLGMGDIKLLAVLGLFLGPYVIIALFLGSIAAAIGGLVFRRGAALSEHRLPFGPYLAAAAALVSMYGPALVSWYLQLVGVL